MEYIYNLIYNDCLCKNPLCSHVTDVLLLFFGTNLTYVAAMKVR